MQAYLPVPLKSSWQVTLFSLRSQSLHASNVKEHTQTIHKLMQAKPTPVIARLNTDAFWNNLKLACNYSEEIEPLHQLWINIAPFAHLNTKELLTLLLDEISPLAQSYEHILAELALNKKSNDRKEAWRPKWFLQTQNNVISHTAENCERLEKLKQKILTALVLRTDAYAYLDAPRNVDDILAALCQQLNGFNKLVPPLEMPQAYCATLDDDRRILIYNLTQQEVILKPIPKRGHVAICSVKEIKKSVEEIHQFRQQVMTKLELNSTQHYIFQSIRKVWRLPFVVSMFLSLISYHFLIHFLGLAAFELISTGLFYMVGLAPVWWLGWVTLKSLWQGLHEYFTYWKKHEILESLLVIENAEQLIANQLSQVIVDIAHFDSQYLEQSLEKHQKQFKTTLKILERYSWLEKFFCQGTVHQQMLLVHDKIKFQQAKIETQLKTFSAHIAKRVGEDIQLLDKTPILPENQWQKLKAFVQANGDKACLKQFEDNSNVVKLWFNALQNNKMVAPSQEAVAFNQPWGGQCVRTDVLKGWQIIINAFTSQAMQAACLQINALLQHKTLLTLPELSQLVHQLDANNASKNLREIQGCLFNSLSPKRPQFASLLSQAHKKMVAQWHSAHHTKIMEAKKHIAEIFATPPAALAEKLEGLNDDDLMKTYELLDGDDIFAYSQQNNETVTQKNPARKFFEDYTGQSAQAFYLLKCVPEYEKREVIAEIAKKRLGWLLENCDEIKDADIELFHNYRLFENEDIFNFADFVRNSPDFNKPWNEKFEALLKSCQACGFDDTGLHYCYKEKNKRIKPFILHQQALSMQKDIPANKPVVNCRPTHV